MEYWNAQTSLFPPISRASFPAAHESQELVLQHCGSALELPVKPFAPYHSIDSTDMSSTQLILQNCVETL